MSSYGVTSNTGETFKSKAALRRAIEAGEPVQVHVTSAFENVLPRKQITDLKPSDVLVGPDPYTNRAWFGNVRISARTGKITVV